jgi:hypothetical protein
MLSLNSAAFPLALFTDKRALFYTSLAAVAAAAILVVTHSRKSSANLTTKIRKPKHGSGKMPPQAGTVKVAKILMHPIKVRYLGPVLSPRRRGQEGKRWRFLSGHVIMSFDGPPIIASSHCDVLRAVVERPYNLRRIHHRV